MEEILSKSTIGLRKAGLASLATTLVLGAGFAGAGSASALPGFNFDRIGGADRYETSTLIADEFNETNADVILANGEPGSYADALTANYLAGEMNAPILLTRDDRTPDSVLAQLEEDGVQNIVVVGGESAINQSQVEALEGEGYTVTRVSGSDRFKTNAEVIEDGGQAENGLGLIATGFNFPDALAGGPLSYKGHPLGLSTQNDIDDEVIAALKAAGVNRVLILGGESAVGAAVVAKLAANEITVERRFAGSDRSETSELVAEYALAELGFTNEHVNVASGYVEGYGADALAGGPLTGKQNRPLLITKDVNQPDDVLDFLNAHDDTLIDGIIFGGNAAISVQAQAQMEEAAQGEVQSNQSFTVTSGGDAATIEEGEVRQFSFTGIEASEVDIVLAHCDDVTTDENGMVSFRDAGDNDTADFGDVAGAAITVVNGVTSDGQDVSPVNGGVSFTVESGTQTCYVPVVFADEADDSTLNLDANDQPTDAFGIGGDTTVVPAESATMTLTADEDINSVDKAANQIITTRALYNYDANDRYFIESTTDDSNNTADALEEVTLAEFEAELSEGDQLSEGTTYQSNPELSSTFLLEDTAPAAPAAPTASGTTDTSTVLTFTGVSDADQITVYCESDATQTDAATVTTNSDVCATANQDADADTVGFQVNVTGLNPDTLYSLAGTQTVGGEESGLSPEVDVTTAAGPVDEPTITDAQLTNDAVVEGLVDEGDVWELDFSEAMAAINDGDRIDLVDADGDTFRIVCDSAIGTIAADPTQGEALCELTADDADGVMNDLTITITTAPTDRNAAGDAALEYPATITATNGLTDADGDNAEVDLANSADVVVDQEA
jgi:putative cell wall-binding protein